MTDSSAAATEAQLPPIRLAELKTACSTCSLREMCLPVGLSRAQLEILDQLVSVRKRVRRGDSLFRAGDAFRTLYAIRSGFFKTRVTAVDGRDQVTGFLMAGELLGMDGIGTEAHVCDAIALEDGELCVIPYDKLEEMSRRFEPLQHHFHRVMSREIVRDHGVMLLLGSMRAEERLAAFLVNLSQRLAARGFSPSEFVLRMSRAEIGSFLGLKIETVSRLFTRFQDAGLLAVRQKNVRITNGAGLEKVIGLRC